MSRGEKAAELLRVLWRNGPLPRRSLENLLHISRPTLDKLIKELSLYDLLIPSGKTKERGGRPATLFRLNPRARLALGVDLELPGLYLVIADLLGEILHEREIRLTGSLASPHETLRRISGLLLDWLKELGVPREKTIGVGVGMPAFFEGDTVTVKGENLPTWIRVPAKEILSRELGIPVKIGHDVHLMALAESKRAGLDDKVMLYLAFRSGVRGDVRMGACLLVRGEIYHGAHGNGGTLHGAFVAPAEIQGKNLGEAAKTIVERLSPHILQAIALLDPEVVVINAEELGELSVPVIQLTQEAISTVLQEEPIGPVEVRRAQVVEAPGALGAAMAVIQELFAHPESLIGEVRAGESRAFG